MLDPLVRPMKDAVLEPVARAAGRTNPHVITAAALAAGLGSAGAAAAGRYGSALLLWLLNRTLDGLDGVVARRTGRQSDLGGYVDIVADFVVYAAIPLGVAFGAEARDAPIWREAALLLAAFYVNAVAWLYVSALVEKRAAGGTRAGGPTSVVMPEGLVAGTETVLFFCAFLLLPDAAGVLFTVMAVLVTLTIVQRVVQAIDRLR